METSTLWLRLEFEERQIADLAAVGVVTSAEIVRQSERFELYRNAIDRLTERRCTVLLQP